MRGLHSGLEWNTEEYWDPAWPVTDNPPGEVVATPPPPPPPPPWSSVLSSSSPPAPVWGRPGCWGPSPSPGPPGRGTGPVWPRPSRWDDKDRDAGHSHSSHCAVESGPGVRSPARRCELPGFRNVESLQSRQFHYFPKQIDRNTKFDTQKRSNNLLVNLQCLNTTIFDMVYIFISILCLKIEYLRLLRYLNIYLYTTAI